MPPSTTDDEVLRMLQTALVERFHLRMHWQEKELPVYALVVDKNGPNLVPTADADAPPSVTLMPYSLDAHNRSMDGLAAILRQWTDREVVNMTGLNGSYDFKLKWSPDSTDPALKGAASPGQPTNPAVRFAESGSPLLVLKSLGLRAERRRVPLKFLIIDSADKTPAEN
jgi:uncharacterized protein (TIGR03435 family)